MAKTVSTVPTTLSTKIDTIDTVVDAIAVEVTEIEKHIHNKSRWFGLAAVPDAELHRADNASMTPFVMDAGNDTWGTWLQILGSDDTPFFAGNTFFDLHRILITDVERDDTLTIIQIGYDASGADAITNETYSEFMLTPEKNAKQDPFDLLPSFRTAVGTKVWARCWVDGANTGTVDFYFGTHEYDV